MSEDKKICVLGLGYIGLPTTLLLARAGFQVTGVDVNQEKLKKLRQEGLPFREEGFNELFQNQIANINLQSEPEPADVFIIAVPTPVEGHEPDISAVKQATKSIAEVVEDGNLVIVESTVPPGTTEKVVHPLLNEEVAKQIQTVFAPERATPGKIIQEIIENNRILGSTSEKATERTRKIYSSFVNGEIRVTDATTAETVKILENTYRDINIGFANEIAKLSEQIGINAWEAIGLANLHPRVNIHQPGPGVGGHCIPVDPWFFVRKDGVGNDMIRLARKINDTMPQHVIKSVEKLVKDIQNPTITILGAAYKGNVDDWRESPVLKIIKLAQEKNWNIKIHDPFAKDFPYQIEPNLQKAIKNSDCLLVATYHDEYENLDPKAIKNMNHKSIYDARNCINPQEWQNEDFKVTILGQKNNA